MSSDTNSRRSTWILAGLVVGAVLGIVAKMWFGGPGLDAAVANVIKPIGTVFLQLIFMVVVPLIFSAIVLGVVELGDVGRLGRVGLRCLGMTVLLSGLSVVVGLSVVNVFQPGKSIAPEVRDKLVAQYTTQADTKIAQASTSDDGALVLFDGEFRVDVVPGEKMMGVVAYRFTAARVSHPEISAPGFLLTPRADADRLKALFSAGPIEFPDDPEFSRQFELQGHQVEAIRAYFTPEFRAALKQSGPRLELEGRAGHLLHFSSIRLAPSQLPEFIQKTRQLAQLFWQRA